MSATALIVVSLDSKADEALFLRDRLRAGGVEALILDFGIQAEPALAPDISARDVAVRGGGDLDTLRAQHDRAAALDVMAKGAAAIAAALWDDTHIAGVISLGGSGGTTVGTAAMRALPLGVPKVMVSTIASGDTRHYVDISDILMLNAVADFAGLNPISETILANAAAALTGMITARQIAPVPKQSSNLIAASMFGVTTPLIEQCRALLHAAGYTLIPFHATGTGGRTMEKLIDEGYFVGVLDLTTTEWADEVVGGTLSAGPDRLAAAARAGVPQIVAPGALDMVNFTGPAGVPGRFAGRTLHRHAEGSMLMRTTPAENAEIGRRIAEKLNASRGPVTVLFPLQGFSALDRAGSAFYSADADGALLDALTLHLKPPVHLEILDCHVNDAAFARTAVATLLSSLNPTLEMSHAQNSR
jgi:uncharacterized protein (UPF0261 family)